MFGPFSKKSKEAPSSSDAVAPVALDPAAPPLRLHDATAVVGGLAWYQLQYDRAMKLALLLGLVLLAAFALIAFLLIARPTPKFFAATPDLRLAPLVPLEQPVLSQQGLINWCAETVTSAVSLDFLEWREKLSRTREHFDEDAFKSFLASLETSGVLSMVRDKRLSVSAVVTKAPVITASGVVDGKASWKIEFPLVISYESSQGVESAQKLIATALVRRASTVVTPRGVVIQQIVLKRDS